MNDRLPFCPMVRITKRGPMLVNPKVTNNERVEALARELFGERWKRPAAWAIGIHRDTITAWLTADDIPDEAVQRLVNVARAKVAKLEFAIEQARIPPWIK